MGKPVKIAIIGAGSAQFSLGLVRDLCLTRNFSGSTVCLMDISEERVDMVHTLARRYADELGFDLKFEKTMDRIAALRDADFVINTASLGDHGGISYDLDPNMVFNLIVGGGILNMQMFLDLARDVEKLCPEAWLIQEANPVFEGCTLMTRETPIKIVGLCHGHYGVYEMAEILGLDKEHITWQAPGFNHVIYLTHFYYKGEDAYPLLDAWIEKKAEEYWQTYKPKFNDNQMSRAAIHQYRALGYMPIGDTVRAGGWWYHKDLDTKKRWFGPLGGFDSREGWASYVASLEETRDKMFAVAGNPSLHVTEIFPAVKSKEQMAPLMDALANDAAGYFQVNIPNNGLISGIPDDVVVEVPAYAGKRGIQGIHVGKLPESIMLQIMWPRLAWCERAVSLAKAPTRPAMLDAILHRHVFMGTFYSPPVESYEEAEAELATILQLAPQLAEMIEEGEGSPK